MSSLLSSSVSHSLRSHSHTSTYWCNDARPFGALPIYYHSRHLTASPQYATACAQPRHASPADYYHPGADPMGLNCGLARQMLYN